MNTTKQTAVGIGDIRSWLENGARVALYIRHAERPPLRDDDPTFGETLGLTEQGRLQALALGARLRGAVRDVRLMASPMERTRRTVQLIAEGAGLGAVRPVEDAPEIGVGNVFLDPAGAHREMGGIGSMTYMIDYLTTGEAPCSRPVHEATRLAVQWIRQTATAPLNLFGSHDLTIAASLAGLGLARFTADNWIPYLTGLALIEQNGRWQHHWFA